MEAVAAKAVTAAAAKTAATSAATSAAAGTFAVSGGTSLAAGTFAGVGAGSAAAGAGLYGAGAAAGGGLLASFGSSLLTGLQVIGAVDAVVSPFMIGQRAADIADINAAQTNLDIQQKLLQGRESSVRALQTLNDQTAHNIAAGFASGVGLSPSVASSIDSISRQYKFDDTLQRTTNILQAGSLQRTAELQRAQGQTAKMRGVFESTANLGRSAKTIKETLFS